MNLLIIIIIIIIINIIIIIIIILYTNYLLIIFSPALWKLIFAYFQFKKPLNTIIRCVCDHKKLIRINASNFCSRNILHFRALFSRFSSFTPRYFSPLHRYLPPSFSSPCEHECFMVWMHRSVSRKRVLHRK